MKLYAAYPEDYPTQAARSNVTGLFFCNATLRHKKLDLKTIISTYWPQPQNRPEIVVAFEDSVEVGFGRTKKETFPIYRYEDSQAALIDLMESGVKKIFCEGYGRAWGSSGGSNTAARWVNMLIREGDRRGVKIHLMGMSSLSVLLGLNVHSADVRFRVLADQKLLCLANGRRICLEDLGSFNKNYISYFRAIGMKTTDVTNKQTGWEGRIEFNIKSFMYGLANVKDNPAFTLPTVHEPGNGGARKHTAKSRKAGAEKKVNTERYKKIGAVCDFCMIKKCALRSPGMVCPKVGGFQALSEHFKTRSVASIVEGLQFVLGEQANRFTQGRAMEQDSGILDGDVTSIGRAVVKDGIALVKLLNPALNPAAAIININNPKVLMGMQSRLAQAGGDTFGSLEPERRRELIPATTEETD